MKGAMAAVIYAGVLGPDTALMVSSYYPSSLGMAARPKPPGGQATPGITGGYARGIPPYGPIRPAPND